MYIFILVSLTVDEKYALYRVKIKNEMRMLKKKSPRTHLQCNKKNYGLFVVGLFYHLPVKSMP